ncbi:uncharacterized protein LOC109595946 isoform X2 [Aethina tumida]|uniref:uncharacterized protein LOC109595946 isoform X2 n=1 Tax=Aethina tumida TaxID=116153 RepID=UPI00096B202C|nr:uncharacterized protein LOC109595946 isoform X2 [Aethina tumida]
MKNVLNKLTGPKKLVRKILSKSSISSHTFVECKSQSSESEMKDEAESDITQEMESLKEQVDNLKASLDVLQRDSEHKELVIAKLLRDKEKISQDLLKQKRSNTSIAQQLEDERIFYYKEKEMYCQEMNELKKLKQSCSVSTLVTGEKTIQEYKDSIEQLKEKLKETMEANYNLSIKYLRMKNTKTCLRNEYKKLQEDYEKVVADLKGKIEKLTNEMEEMAQSKLSLSTTTSSKKYLQIVKENSCLIYENLCLQLQVDHLSSKLQKHQHHEIREEKNNHLQYIKHGSAETLVEKRHYHHKKHASAESLPSRPHNHKERKKVRIHEETPEKLERQKPVRVKNNATKEGHVVKIYERKERPGVPNLQMVDEDKEKSLIHVPEKDNNTQRLHKGPKTSKETDKLNLLQVSDGISQLSNEFDYLGFAESSATEVLVNTSKPK